MQHTLWFFSITPLKWVNDTLDDNKNNNNTAYVCGMFRLILFIIKLSCYSICGMFILLCFTSFASSLGFCNKIVSSCCCCFGCCHDATFQSKKLIFLDPVVKKKSVLSVRQCNFAFLPISLYMDFMPNTEETGKNILTLI